jgi:hypothetical protein
MGGCQARTFAPWCSMMGPMTPAEQLCERGYAVFEEYLDPGAAATLRERLLALAEPVRPPTLYEPDTRELGEASAVSASGLALRGFAGRHPELLDRYLRPPLVALLHDTLGEVRVEELGALISDTARPFFRWHTHIGGEDEGVRFKSGRWPRPERVERVLTLLYLDDVDEEAGALYVLPRTIGEPTEPPGNIDEVEWPGRVALTPKAGTLVALEQCTWHAAAARQRPGERVLAAAYFAGAEVAPADWADPAAATLDLARFA